MGDIRYKEGLMKNPVLDRIKTFAVQELSNFYGFCSLADGEDMVMINSSDQDGNDIKITIVVKEDEEEQSEFEQYDPDGYKDDDGGNLPNG